MRHAAASSSAGADSRSPAAPLTRRAARPSMSQKWKWTLWTLAGTMAVAAVFGPRISQPLSYHLFADQRTFLGIPHFLDVVSNLAFLVVGVWGMVFVMKASSRTEGAFLRPSERWPYFFFFLGVLLTAFGSASYHWAPDNAGLVWDRLPMAVGFMGLLAAVLGERIAPLSSSRMLIPLLGVGIGSVLYWRWTDLAGRDDLRSYLLVQFGSLLLVLALCFLRSRYTRGNDLFAVVGLYALAKMFEGLDKPIFAVSAGFVSGHTLKHLIAAVACYFVLHMLMLRRPCSRDSSPTTTS
jgi:hypothetical protein